jgi:hypothetical protein
MLRNANWSRNVPLLEEEGTKQNLQTARPHETKYDSSKEPSWVSRIMCEYSENERNIGCEAVLATKIF